MPSEGFSLEQVANTSTMQLTTTGSDIGLYRKKGMCGGRSSLEKILLFLVILTAATAIAACIAIAVVVQKGDDSDQSTTVAAVVTDAPTTPIPVDDSVCTTAGCVAAAARVNAYRDTSVHPCDNFFEYACGNWIKKHPIPEDRSSIDSFGLLREEVEVILKDVLEKPSSEENYSSAILKAKHFMESCTNQSLIDKRGLQPLDDLYSRVGHWPLLNSTWDNSSFDLVQLLIDMRKHGYRPLIYLYVYTDEKNSSTNIIYLDQPPLIMPGRDYYNTSVWGAALPALTTLIGGVAEALGASDPEQDVHDLVEFEQQVAAATIPSEDRRDSTKLYNLMTVAELSTNISDKFDWLRYIHDVLDLGGVTINEDEPVVVRAPEYLKQLFALLENTPSKTIANYVMAAALVDLVQALPAKFRDLDAAYQKAVFGTQTPRARWRVCVGQTRDVLGEAVGRMFVDDVFDETARDTALKMIGNIRGAFNELLKTSDWMDSETRTVAEEKAGAIGENIGYPGRIKNNTVLDDVYKNEDLVINAVVCAQCQVQYSSEEYFENLIRAAEWSTVESLKRLRDVVDKDEWGTSPAVVNAYYSPSKNHITFPAAILQPPFFLEDYPKSMNYGGIGLVIGHEITHGFDDQGRQYDKDGNLKQWWTEEVIEKFKKKAKCIVDQYSEYVVPEAGMNLNGVNTQGENIADNGGLRQSFTAYREWVRTQGKEEAKLPGVDLNHSQLFFVNFAQIWCTSMRRENAINRILTGVHSPGRFRVIGSLHNSNEFSEVFNCPQTSYMNPEKKCRVW